MKKINQILFFVMVGLILQSCNHLPYGKKTDTVEIQIDTTIKNTEIGAIIDSVVPNDYQIPNELPYLNTKNDLILERIYPIGWSKGGNFAYISLPPDEACGCLFFDVLIIDMKTDKILWHLEYNDEGSGDNLNSAWWKHKNQIISKLKEFSIIPQQRMVLQNFPFQNESFTFKKDLKVEYQTDPDFGFDVIKKIKLSIERSDKTTKQIVHFVEKEYPMSLRADVLGLLKSPFENRVAILMMSEQRGYEGPPNTVHLQFAGCDLHEGFQ